MTNSGNGISSLVAIYEKQHQNQSSLILTNAGFAFRSADSEKMIAGQLSSISALCKTLDAGGSQSVALQFSQQCDALGTLLTSIQSSDLTAISKRATLSQPQLKGAANKLHQVDAQLLANLKSLSKRIEASESHDGHLGQGPEPTEQYNPAATLSWD